MTIPVNLIFATIVEFLSVSTRLPISFQMSVSLSVCLFFPSLCDVCLSILSVFVAVSVCLFFPFLCDCLSAHSLSVCLCLSVCLSVCTFSVCLSVCLSYCLSVLSGNHLKLAFYSSFSPHAPDKSKPDLWRSLAVPLRFTSPLLFSFRSAGDTTASELPFGSVRTGPEYSSRSTFWSFLVYVRTKGNVLERKRNDTKGKEREKRMKRKWKKQQRMGMIDKE